MNNLIHYIERLVDLKIERNRYDSFQRDPRDINRELEDTRDRINDEIINLNKNDENKTE